MYFQSIQTDTAGNTYYTFQWGPNTGDCQHITIDPRGVKTADWGGPPKMVEGKFGQRMLTYDFTSGWPVLVAPVQSAQYI
jgi:hypothetical protein